MERHEAKRITRCRVKTMDDILGKPVRVLDHGFIRLVDYMGDQAAIVQAARVSYGDGTKSVPEDRGLIRYLMRHWHTSPFEMCEIKVHVKLPIFVARQWIRHRTANVNEVSARYSVLPGEFYVPDPRLIQPQSDDNKQCRSGEFEEDAATDLARLLGTSMRASYDDYQALTRAGLARELAREVLPVGTYTEWYWKIDLHNLLHFLRLRMDPHAQVEIREYAEALSRIVREWLPDVWEAFEDYRLHAHTFSGPEMEVLRSVLEGLRYSSTIRSSDFVPDSSSARETAEFHRALGLAVKT